MTQRQLGGISIDRVIESNSPDFDPYEFFRETSEADWAPHLEWLQPRAMDPVSGNLIFPMQSYVVRTAHHTILVDACVGNHKDRPGRDNWHQTTGTQYMDGLAALGLTPEDILSQFYNKVVYIRGEGGWQIPYLAEAWRGMKPAFDIVDAKSGEVMFAAGQKISPRAANKPTLKFIQKNIQPPCHQQAYALGLHERSTDAEWCRESAPGIHEYPSECTSKCSFRRW